MLTAYMLDAFIHLGMMCTVAMILAAAHNRYDLCITFGQYASLMALAVVGINLEGEEE